MSESTGTSKTLQGRISQKHDLEVNWLRATNFTPKKGEIIVYDIEVDENGAPLALPEGRTTPYTYERIKIGNGKDNPTALPFLLDTYIKPHNHDNTYYTETEIDDMVSDLEGAINGKEPTHFVAIEGETTYQAINTALNAGKIVLLKDASDYYYSYSRTTSLNSMPVHIFACNLSDGYYEVYVTIRNVWSMRSYKFASEVHTHEGTYYTEDEIDAKIQAINESIAGKEDTHTHPYAPTDHDHKLEDITDIEASASEVNVLKGVTASTDELNILTGATLTTAELNYVAGVTSGIQTQLDGKAASDHPHNYAGSSSNGGPATSADKVKESLVIKLNGGGTADTNEFTFNGSNPKTINITPSSIGAADSIHSHNDKYYTETEVDELLTGKADTSHGTHVPSPEAADNKKFLRNDNTWQEVTPANIGAALAVHSHEDKYYTKSDTYTKTEVDNLVSQKADVSHTLSKGTDTTSTQTLSFGGTFTAVTDTSVNGHIITDTTTTYTLPSDRLFQTLVPSGTNLKTEGIDLNTPTYLKVGKYFCGANTIAKTFLNCPTTLAFMMEVYSPLNQTIDNETGTWVYRIRKLLSYQGEEYIQYCYTDDIGGNWHYGDWVEYMKGTHFDNISTELDNHKSVNHNAFGNIKINNATGIEADNVHDTLNIVAGDNVTITSDAASGKITISAIDTNTDTDTHYTTKLVATSTSGTEHAATTNGNTYLRLFDSGTAREKINIKGTGATTVTSDANGVITINSTDNDTHYVSKNVVAGSASAISDTTTVLDNTKVCLNHVENGSVQSSHLIYGASPALVKTDEYGNIVINVTNASTSKSGAVKLSNSVVDTSTTTAATSKAVKSAYDKAEQAYERSVITYDWNGSIDSPEFDQGQGMVEDIFQDMGSRRMVRLRRIDIDNNNNVYSYYYGFYYNPDESIMFVKISDSNLTIDRVFLYSDGTMERYSDAPVDYYWLQDIITKDDNTGTHITATEVVAEQVIAEYITGTSSVFINDSQGDGVYLQSEGYIQHPDQENYGTEVASLTFYGGRGDEATILRKVASGIDDEDAVNMRQLNEKEPKRFVAIENETTFQEIKNALNAGKIVVAKDTDGWYYDYLHSTATQHNFMAAQSNGNVNLYVNSNGWGFTNYQYASLSSVNTLNTWKNSISSISGSDIEEIVGTHL